MTERWHYYYRGGALCGRVPAFMNKSTDPADVTCKWCLSALKRLYAALGR